MRTVGEILGARTTYWVAKSWSVRRVVDYLCEKGVGAMPVTDEDLVVGVFSERDLMHRVVHQGRSLDETRISEVMTKGVIAVRPEDSYMDAKAVMIEHNVRHLVVKDHDGRLKGFISLRELSETALAEAQSLISKLNDDYYRTPDMPEE